VVDPLRVMVGLAAAIAGSAAMIARSARLRTSWSSRPPNARWPRAPTAVITARVSAGELAAAAGAVARPEENSQTGRLARSAAKVLANSRAAGSQCPV